jgi:hypothetical protein
MVMLAGLPFIGAITLPDRHRYGYMDVDRWHAMKDWRHKRVLINGRDITDGCKWFDDVTGEACRFLRNANGNFYLGIDGRPATEVLRGEIRVIDVRDTL